MRGTSTVFSRHCVCVLQALAYIFEDVYFQLMAAYTNGDSHGVATIGSSLLDLVLEIGA